jgi:hypothetical protein
VENLDVGSLNQFNFFASEFVKKLSLSEISMIATDLDQSAQKAKNGYKIKIFGRLA